MGTSPIKIFRVWDGPRIIISNNVFNEDGRVLGQNGQGFADSEVSPKNWTGT